MPNKFVLFGILCLCAFYSMYNLFFTFGCQEADAIKGIVLDMSKIKDIDLNYESFEKLCNLRFLKFYYQTHCSGHSMYTPKVHAPHGLKYLPDELRSLHWHGYPLTTLPTDYSLENLVELNLPYSNLEQLWEGMKVQINI